jgi:hypothetical protein
MRRSRAAWALPAACRASLEAPSLCSSERSSAKAGPRPSEAALPAVLRAWMAALWEATVDLNARMCLVACSLVEASSFLSCASSEASEEDIWRGVATAQPPQRGRDLRPSAIRNRALHSRAGPSLSPGSGVGHWSPTPDPSCRLLTAPMTFITGTLGCSRGLWPSEKTPGLWSSTSYGH